MKNRTDHLDLMPPAAALRLVAAVVPNAVYALATLERSFEDAAFRLHLDVGLADRYGRHSGESKHFTANTLIGFQTIRELDAEETMLALDALGDGEWRRFAESVVLAGADAIARSIAEGRSVPVTEVPDTGQFSFACPRPAGTGA